MPVLITPQGVDELLGAGGGEEEEEEEQDEDGAAEGNVVQSVRSSYVGIKGPSPPPDLLNTDGTLMLFAGSSCSRTG